MSSQVQLNNNKVEKLHLVNRKEQELQRHGSSASAIDLFNKLLHKLSGDSLEIEDNADETLESLVEFLRRVLTDEAETEMMSESPDAEESSSSLSMNDVFAMQGMIVGLEGTATEYSENQAQQQSQIGQYLMQMQESQLQDIRKQIDKINKMQKKSHGLFGFLKDVGKLLKALNPARLIATLAVETVVDIATGKNVGKGLEGQLKATGNAIIENPALHTIMGSKTFMTILKVVAIAAAVMGSLALGPAGFAIMTAVIALSLSGGMDKINAFLEEHCGKALGEVLMVTILLASAAATGGMALGFEGETLAKGICDALNLKGEAQMWVTLAVTVVVMVVALKCAPSASVEEAGGAAATAAEEGGIEMATLGESAQEMERGVETATTEQSLLSQMKSGYQSVNTQWASMVQKLREYPALIETVEKLQACTQMLEATFGLASGAITYEMGNITKALGDAQANMTFDMTLSTVNNEMTRNVQSQLKRTLDLFNQMISGFSEIASAWDSTKQSLA